MHVQGTDGDIVVNSSHPTILGESIMNDPFFGGC